MTAPLPRSGPPEPPDALARDRIELEWLDAIRRGDERAFEALFRAYVEPLYAFAYTYVESQAIAQELVQELFCRLWERREELERPRSVHAYLYGAVRNRAINYLRDRRVEQLFKARALRDGLVRETTAHESSAHAELEAEALATEVSRAVAEMPARCREVFTLTRDQGMSYAQVAAVLGISPRTVEVHMGRALALLRQRLGGWLS